MGIFKVFHLEALRLQQDTIAYRRNLYADKEPIVLQMLLNSDNQPSRAMVRNKDRCNSTCNKSQIPCSYTSLNNKLIVNYVLRVHFYYFAIYWLFLSLLCDLYFKKYQNCTFKCIFINHKFNEKWERTDLKVNSYWNIETPNS